MSSFGFQAVLLHDGCASRMEGWVRPLALPETRLLTGEKAFVIVEILLKGDQSAVLDFHELFDRAF